ncbi:PREDICTED: interferon omega-1-like [Myotis brandtii]|uniref:interferon omega-1-like n=1 Tax=Myotis brandtii TaxID=109478 RepID=UPI0003BB91D7|nr:PREDICTED: interferon omega-1-like [Myotis brandtii]
MLIKSWKSTELRRILENMEDVHQHCSFTLSKTPSTARSTLICPWPSCSLYSLNTLVVSSYGHGESLGCDLPQDHVLLSRENLMLLSQMSTISPFFCLKDRKDFRFPRATVDGSQVQKAQAIAVLHEMLQQVFNLLSTETLKRYFQGICLYMKEKKYSDCAWEVVRVEIRKSFYSITALQERLRNNDGDVGSP